MPPVLPSEVITASPLPGRGLHGKHWPCAGSQGPQEGGEDIQPKPWGLWVSKQEYIPPQQGYGLAPSTSAPPEGPFWLALH